MEHTPSLLTLHELARRLRVSASWLREESDAGRIPCLKAGRRRLYNLEAIERVLAIRAAGTAPETPERNEIPEVGQESGIAGDACEGPNNHGNLRDEDKRAGLRSAGSSGAKNMGEGMEV